MPTAASTADLHETPLLDARTQLALCITIAAFLLGALADGLLRATPWGLNLLLWLAALLGAAGFLANRFQAHTLVRDGPVYLLVGLFALGCAWRDSPTLKGLDLGAVLLLLALLAWRGQAGALWRRHLSGYALALAKFAFDALAGFLNSLWRDVQWRQLPNSRWTKSTISVGVGLLLAAPLVLVFGGLFSAADAAFHKIVVDLFDMEALFQHLFFTGLGAWIACGFLRALLVEDRPTVPPVTLPDVIKLGPVETGIVLGCLNVLFLAFILVQVRYFFGGSAQVEVVPGLTYAEYARRGFFELVTVAILVLPLLLAADWLLRHERRKRLFRSLASALVVMLFVIMASAVQRMRLYQQEYGLTELRLYTTVFMGWLAMVFIWFLATVLRGARERFTFGALASGLAVLLILHFVNPDAWIVRANLQRAANGKGLDVAYATSLSADAIPTLAQSLETLNPRQRSAVVKRLLARWPATEFSDWRTLSVSGLRARRALSALSKPSAFTSLTNDRK